MENYDEFIDGFDTEYDEYENEDETEYDIEYDSVLEAYVWYHEGAGLVLGASTYEEAIEEVEFYVENGIYLSESLEDNEFDGNE